MTTITLYVLCSNWHRRTIEFFDKSLDQSNTSCTVVTFMLTGVEGACCLRRSITLFEHISLHVYAVAFDVPEKCQEVSEKYGRPVNSDSHRFCNRNTRSICWKVYDKPAPPPLTTPSNRRRRRTSQQPRLRDTVMQLVEYDQIQVEVLWKTFLTDRKRLIDVFLTLHACFDRKKNFHTFWIEIY